MHARVVSALVREGTMLGAAERLGVTQPAISAALGSLEKEIGLTLFYRTRRGLTLTVHGQALLPKIKRLLDIAAEVKDFGKDHSADEGVIRIAGRQGFMQNVFPTLLSKLKERKPNIEIEAAHTAEQQTVVDELQNGRVDLAFAASPKIKSIVAEVIFRDPVLIAVGEDNAILRKKTITQKDVSDLTFCIPLGSDRLRSPMNNFLRKLPQKPKIILQTNDYTLMRNLIVREGVAGFVYAHMFASDNGRSGLTPLPIKNLHLTRDLTILHRRDDLMPHVRTARDIFIEETQKLLEETAKKYR